MNIKKLFIWLSIIISAFGLGFAIFNIFIMPRVMGTGKDIIVPNLIGKSLVNAQKILLTQNFTIGETRDVYDTIFSQGIVVGQKPMAGRKINILVSKGALKVKVPFLEQMSQDQAMRVLNSLGINPTIVESLRSTTISVGKIISTEPGPGSEIQISSQFKVFVSSGSSGIFLMPMLVGLSVNAAVDSIRSNGLALGMVQQIPSDEPKGYVVIQYPEDGMRIRTGDTVRLIVSGKKR
jgi:serine/threonine-protein kinase